MHFITSGLAIILAILTSYEIKAKNAIYFFQLKKKSAHEEKLLNNKIISSRMSYKYIKLEFDINYDT